MLIRCIHTLHTCEDRIRPEDNGNHNFLRVLHHRFDYVGRVLLAYRINRVSKCLPISARFQTFCGINEMRVFGK